MPKETVFIFLHPIAFLVHPQHLTGSPPHEEPVYCSACSERKLSWMSKDPDIMIKEVVNNKVEEDVK